MAFFVKYTIEFEEDAGKYRTISVSGEKTVEDLDGYLVEDDDGKFNMNAVTNEDTAKQYVLSLYNDNVTNLIDIPKEFIDESLDFDSHIIIDNVRESKVWQVFFTIELRHDYDEYSGKMKTKSHYYISEGSTYVNKGQSQTINNEKQIKDFLQDKIDAWGVNSIVQKEEDNLDEDLIDGANIIELVIDKVVTQKL